MILQLIFIPLHSIYSKSYMYRLGILLTTIGVLIAMNAMAEMPRDYYPDNLEGRNKGALKSELHKLIKEHERISYGRNGTWVVFRDSDVRPDGSIWDMYSDIVRYFPASGSHREMNIEHSVPKSWWGDDYPYSMDASLDLHHLVPSDATANSKKSNYPLGEVYGTPSYDNGVVRVGQATGGYSFNVFEPADEYKGDFARMYMYIVTCYQDYTWRSLATSMFVTGSYPTLNSYGQELLLRWHREDPVSRKEIDRNNAVYLHQHNRNPFIDYPNLAEYIWGDSTEYAFSFAGSGIEAATLNVKSGDVIVFDNEELHAGNTIAYNIKGRNITAPVYVRLAMNDHFDVSPVELSATDVVSDEGATLYITYHPAEYGIHETLLRIECDDLPDDIELTLRGLCQPTPTGIVTVEGLKARYSRSDADIKLRLRNTQESVTWHIDGSAVSNNIFSPASLSVGMHTISFETERVSGHVRVEITN